MTVTPDEPTFFCYLCQDEPSGWRSVWCPGSGRGWQADPHERHMALTRQVCARPLAHAAHPWVEKCACAAVNPVAATARARGARATSRPRSSRRERAGGEV